MKNKQGFTLIELTLVLGIAGLIMLMVFIALPSVMRAARDSERRDHVLTFIRKLKDFQANSNRGALPSGDGDGNEDGSINIDSADLAAGTATFNTWLGFYRDYLLQNGDKEYPVITDPIGGVAYRLSISTCDATSIGSKCTTGVNDSNFAANDYTLFVTTSATCQSEDAVKSANARNVAVQYKLEGAGIYCANT